MWLLAGRYFVRTPQQMGLAPDGDAPGAPAGNPTAPRAVPLPGRALWRSRAFLTLAAAMALGLFAQIGLLTHLFSLLVPALGERGAGLAAGASAVAAIAGRTLVGWLMPPGADRRRYACASHLVQIAGSLAFLLAGGEDVALLLTGVLLFGAGIGNATSLPPLIAQVEFTRDDVARAVPFIIAISQASFAFAPAGFGVIREFAPGGSIAAPGLFLAAAALQALAILAFLAGRRRAG
jgi:hypothetical protein